MKTYAATHKGLVRKNNEDRFLVQKYPDNSFLLAVADGMGGEVAGDHAAELAIATIKGFKRFSEKNENRLSQLVMSADSILRDEANRNTALEGMGTTLTCAFVSKNKLYWAHVGDSRLYVKSGQELAQITIDQNMAQFLFEEGELTENEMARHPARNQLDQCVGCGHCQPVAGVLDVMTGDLLMLSTDGLHGEVSRVTIASILHHHTDIKTKANTLIKSALAAGGRDNVTVLLAVV